MSRNTWRLILFVILSSAAGSCHSTPGVSLSLRADDWPQWRGPDRTGISKETGLLKAWPKGGPKLAWTFKNAGSGASSFAIVKNVLYTLGTRGDSEIILALDATKGTELWDLKIGPIFNFKGNTWGVGPRSTPTVDGNYLYALGGTGNLVCVDLTKKQKQATWSINLAKDLGGAMMEVGGDDWGFSESPLIDGNLLICTPGGPQGTLAALDKTTGKVKWRSKELTNNAPYSSVIAADIHGKRQYIQMSYNNTEGKEQGVVSGVDAASGKVLWSEILFKKSSYAMAPTPVVRGNQVYVTTGYGAGCHLFEIDANQKATEKFAKKYFSKVKNTHGGVILIGDHIYGHSEPDAWICQDFNTGNVVWTERNELNCNSGAITAADGLLYLFTDKGEVGLVEPNPSPDGFKLISSFSLPERSNIPNKDKSSKSSKPWAHPVIANGLLYVRDHDLIFAYDVKK
jgi:outer membrane protein assembly factor BamB